MPAVAVETPILGMQSLVSCLPKSTRLKGVEKSESAIIIDGGWGDTEPSTVVDCTTDEWEVVREGKGELAF